MSTLASSSAPSAFASPVEILAWAIETWGPRLAFTTSFQAEGMALIDMAAKLSSSIRVVTLDTGRLPDETYQMMETVRSRYGVRVETVSPDAGELQTMVSRFGPNLFYESVPNRMLCCHVRKVRPLARKMEEFEAWVVGLRREQSETRGSLAVVEEIEGRHKISPLAGWTKQQVDDYLRRHDVPVHPLYSRGYTSIGCHPCTRATQPGEDERAGRWWWERDTGKECGLHFTADGKAERTVDVLVREILSAARP